MHGFRNATPDNWLFDVDPDGAMVLPAVTCASPDTNTGKMLLMKNGNGDITEKASEERPVK